tara:strand:+ start:683 stop:1309 length:627 start_codon:yes stop_codon:yes gene_type:complete
MSRVTLVLFLLALSAISRAQNNAINELGSLLQNLDTLSAKITQLIVEPDGGILEESQILLHVKRPDGFYWETISPFPELLVTNGRKLWNYQPDLEQVVVEDWDSSRSDLAAQLLYGRTDGLVDDYYIVVVNSELAQNFELKPKSADSLYEVITIKFIKGSLDLIYIQSTNGERTVWEFRDSSINLPLEDGLFEFTPPAGIEVVNNSIN